MVSITCVQLSQNAAAASSEQMRASTRASGCDSKRSTGPGDDADQRGRQQLDKRIHAGLRSK